MVAAATFTYDEVPARRPDVDDLGGSGFRDDENQPPNYDGTELYAAVPNQQNQLLAGVARVTPLAVVSLVPSGGTYVVDSVNPMGSNVTAASFSISYAGVGDFRVGWAAGVLPQLSAQPIISSNHTSAARIPTAYKYATSTIRILIFDAAGVAADAPVTVAIY